MHEWFKDPPTLGELHTRRACRRPSATDKNGQTVGSMYEQNGRKSSAVEEGGKTIFRDRWGQRVGETSSPF